ncbi:MAG: metallophosphoesterase [Planctomycetes bacterium]|nr:metallophosphoesterase [Planctomycetota bacterium]
MRNARLISRRGFLQLAAAMASSAALGGCTRRAPATYIPPASRREIPPVKDELRLIAVGDWGQSGEGLPATIRGMDAASKTLDGFHAGMFLGDNFYPDGVKSVDDDLWRRYFEEPFDTEQLGNLSWHAILGNHDWRGNVQAQIEYSKRNKRWVMPDHYWRKDFGPSGEKPLLTVLAIDTDKHFEPWNKQLDWLEAQLIETRQASWPRVVIGHHTLVSYSNHGFTSYMVEEFEPLFSKYEIAAYLCGHDHNMQVGEKNGVTYAVLGGGGASLYDVEHGTLSSFARKSHGFGALRVTRKQLSIECRDTTGQVVHTQSRAVA